MKPIIALVLGLWAVAPEALATVRAEVVEYRHGDVVLEGFLAYDDASEAKRPGVLVVHEWQGLGDYVKRRAQQLAELGYVAFAADLYGKGVRAKDHAEAATLSGIYRSDRRLMRARVLAALDELKRHALTDAEHVAAIGYCFGGTTVLELARSGAAIAGVVSFHGGLDTPHPEDARHITARILVLHGAEDPFVPPEQVAAFEQEMRDAGVSYQLIRYEGAVHSFTVPEAGNDPSTGMAYHPEADRQSWAAMQEFLARIFRHSELRNLG